MGPRPWGAGRKLSLASPKARIWTCSTMAYRDCSCRSLLVSTDIFCHFLVELGYRHPLYICLHFSTKYISISSLTGYALPWQRLAANLHIKQTNPLADLPVRLAKFAKEKEFQKKRERFSKCANKKVFR
jgi:hypothetical protein